MALLAGGCRPQPPAPAETSDASRASVAAPTASASTLTAAAATAAERVAAARPGIVRLDRRLFVDDDGPFFAKGATFFAAAWAYRHDRGRLVENLRFLRRGGIDYIRVLGVVGPSAWTDRTVDPAWPDYDDTIAGLTDLAYDEGLRVEWTIFGGVDTTPTPASREALVQRFIAMARGREHKILHWEVANESWQNGFEGEAGRTELHRLAAVLRQGTPNLVALSAAPNEVLAGGAAVATWLYRDSPANLLTAHLDRSQRGPGGEWEPVARAWDVQGLAGVPEAWTSNEPIGPQSSVVADGDPLRIVMSAAVVSIAGGAGYVLHTGPGVRFGGVEDRARDRVANFHEIDRIDEIFAGFSALDRIIPGDQPNWDRSSVETNPARLPFDAEALTAERKAGRVFRMFCAAHGDRFVCAPIGLRGESRYRALRPMTVEAMHPLTGATIRTTTLGTGETLVLDGALPAVLLRGMWTNASAAIAQPALARTDVAMR